jgi:hypothetical protein
MGCHTRDSADSTDVDVRLRCAVPPSSCNPAYYADFAFARPAFRQGCNLMALLLAASVAGFELLRGWLTETVPADVPSILRFLRLPVFLLLALRSRLPQIDFSSASAFTRSPRQCTATARSFHRRVAVMPCLGCFSATRVDGQPSRRVPGLIPSPFCHRRRNACSIPKKDQSFPIQRNFIYLSTLAAGSACPLAA